MSGLLIRNFTDATGVYYHNGVPYSSDGAVLVEGLRTHPYYHFHGCALGQAAGDTTSKFIDLAAGNHGARGANLTDTQMFANAGYVSTVDPGVGAEDSTIHIPFVNLDYTIGEKLIFWWLGAAAVETGPIDSIIMGDGYGTAAGTRGWRVRMLSTGKFSITTWGASQLNSATSTGVPFDGTLHSLAFALDGQGRRYGFWVDEVPDPAFGGAFIAYNAGAAADTKTTNSINIGSSRPGTATSTAAGDGAAVKTRALVILRLPASYTMPNVATLTAVFQQLRANPGKLILDSAF